MRRVYVTCECLVSERASAVSQYAQTVRAVRTPRFKNFMPQKFLNNFGTQIKASETKLSSTSLG